MNATLFMLAGFLCAGLGGELFVRGAVGIARSARIPAGIVGATVAAFATSSPELAVALVSASEGTPTVSFGNLLGANIVNVGFALGLAVAIGGLKTTRAGIGRNYGVAVVAPIVTGLLLLDGGLSRIDGIVLLGCFFAWLATTVHEARRQRSAAAAVLGERGGWSRTLAIAGLGLVLLIIAGELVVSGAHGVGDALGLDPFVVGATLVAVGTTLPELATLMISRLRGHDEVGLGTVLGSNIFNGLFIVGLVAVLSPFEVPIAEAGIPVILGALLVALIYPSPSGRIERRRGFALLALYVAHLATLLQIRAG